MAKPAVLAIGMEPAWVDLKGHPEFTPDLVRRYIETQIERLHAMDYEATSCLIEPGDTAEATVAVALTSKRFDCVVIGAGLREPPSHLLLFEQVINLVHRLAPHAKICFNTTPVDTAEAVKRWL